MTYSVDLRERVVAYVRSGGLRSEASRLFGVDRKSIYSWLRREDLAPKPHGLRKRKLDKAALAEHVRAFPDMLLRERAEHFGVRINAVWVALQCLNISKKNDTLRGEKSR